MERLTSLTDACQRAGGWSRYVSMTSEQVFTKFRRTELLIRGGAVCLILVIAGIYLVVGIPEDWSYLVLIELLVPIVIVMTMLLTRAYQGLAEISDRDCDPQKLIEVVTRLQESGPRRESSFLSLAYATCSYNLGNDDVALQWFDQLTRRRQPAQVELSVLAIRGLIALRRGEVEQARQLRESIAAASLRGKAAEVRTRALASLDAELALRAGDSAAAWRCVEAISHLDNLPVQEVALEYLAACVKDAMGETGEARVRMEAVAANAGTLCLGDRARAWLADHDDQVVEVSGPPSGNDMVTLLK